MALELPREVFTRGPSKPAGGHCRGLGQAG